MSYKTWLECGVVGGLGFRKTHQSFLEKVVEESGGTCKTDVSQA